MPYAYRCAEYPGMEECPGYVVAETSTEVMRLVELHGRIAHDEDPAAWSDEERAQVEYLIRPV